MHQKKRADTLNEFVEQVGGGLIVSCEALEDEPLFGVEIMARMAVAAAQGGARAIRANTPVDIEAIRKAVKLPIIGLYKQEIAGYSVYITPTLAHAQAVVAAGATVIASRSDPPWQLARLRARGDLNELRASELRFTPVESAAYSARDGFQPMVIAATLTSTTNELRGIRSLPRPPIKK